MEIKQPLARAEIARQLATAYSLVQHNSQTFMPAHWLTEEVGSVPPPEERIWVPLRLSDKRKLANEISKVLFTSESELASFDFMLQQWAKDADQRPSSLFIRTAEGLRVLDEYGELVEPDGEFRPNYIKPVLNTDEADKAKVFEIISGWVNSDEEAHSLLHHLATSLAPGWSAVKYVLLLGDGRNGKSVLLSMLSDLFGSENVSNVSRQKMSEQSPICVELNNKLLNIVFDGQMDYIKDSGLEKTLIAGEPGYIRLLYQSQTTRVQTNALFVEALNKEPKSRDKSSALQKRLVRFWFPNVYARDIPFERMMRSEKMLGAFLALLIDHYVTQDEVVEKLVLSKGSLEMQVNQMWMNSPALQFISRRAELSPKYIDAAAWIDEPLDTIVGEFMAWRIAENFTEFSSADTVGLFQDVFVFKWKTVREGGAYGKKRFVKDLRPETEALLAQMKVGEPSDDQAILKDLVDD